MHSWDLNPSVILFDFSVGGHLLNFRCEFDEISFNLSDNRSCLSRISDIAIDRQVAAMSSVDNKGNRWVITEGFELGVIFLREVHKFILKWFKRLKVLVPLLLGVWMQFFRCDHWFTDNKLFKELLRRFVFAGCWDSS